MLMKQTLIKLGTNNKVVNDSVTNFVTNKKGIIIKSYTFSNN